MNNITENNNKTLSLDQIRLISKAIFILRILAKAKANPDAFPLNPGRVAYNETFNVKALSKQEILDWQHANSGGEESYKMTSNEFDDMVGISGMVATTELNGFKYYCLWH